MKKLEQHIYSYSISYYHDNMKAQFERELKNKVPYYRQYEKNIGKLK